MAIMKQSHILRLIVQTNSFIYTSLQTLYSFRHTGAIEIYKRTNNLSILQKAMGHSTLAVTLGYLRGLEIPSLRLENILSYLVGY
jgi:integrase